jgi:hypothetical protein
MIISTKAMLSSSVFAALVIGLATTTAVFAQEAFESEDDGFALQVPQGWVIDDFDNQATELGNEAIAMLCPESDSLPGIGGSHSCMGANLTDGMYISRFTDLQSMPEFEDLPEPPTTDDLVALWIGSLVNSNQSSNVQVVNSTDIDEFKKIVTATYTWHNDAGTGFNPFDDYTSDTDNLIMFALSEDRNTGYYITNPLAFPNFYNQTEHSPAVQQVFNSFQMVPSS